MQRWLNILVVILLLAAESRGDTTLTMRAAVRIDSGQTLTIGHIADVAGDPSVAALPIDSQIEAGRLNVTIADVRNTLTEHGYRLASIAIRGDSCAVIVRAPRSVNLTESETTVQVAEPQPPTTGRTVRDHVRASIERSLGIGAEKLRLHFTETDNPTLDLPTTGLTVHVHPTGLGRQTPIRVTLYGRDGSIDVRRVRVGVQILRDVVRVTEQLARGQRVESSHLAVSQEWLAPDEPHIDPAEALGQRLRRTIDAGERLTDATVEPPIVVERGDIVIVHVVSGAVVIKRESRALESARAGQRIRLEPLAPGAPFQATVEGPGRAVIMLGRSTGQHNTPEQL